MNLTKYLRFSVLLLPILFLWIGFSIHLAKFGNDPNYVYLVNATALCDGKGVGYIDHPGTTVIQIGAVAITLKHLFSNPENETLVRHVFDDSHTFILSIRNVLMLLNALILFLLGWIAFKKTRSIWVALLLQASTFITANTLDHVFTKVSPEPFLFFLTAVFVIVVLWFYADKNKNTWKFVTVFTLLVGAGLATKATFLPLAIFPFIVLPTLKKKLIYSFGVIPSFVLFTIPIIPEYKQMYYWFRGLMSHSGTYGHGKKGIIDVHTYFPDLLRILENNPIFAVVLIVGLIVVAVSILRSYNKKSEKEWDIKILTGLVASAGFGVLMVAKHYHSNHYLIPCLLLSGVIVFFIHKILERTNVPVFVKKYDLPFLVAALVFFIFFVQIPNIKYFNDGYKLTNEEMDSTKAMIDRDYSDYTRIYYYPNSLNPYSALNFGDVYTKRRMLPQIKEVYGNIYFYHSFEKTIKDWDTEVFLDDLVKQKGNKILLIGGPRDEKVVQEMGEQGFPLQEIYKGRLQVIYKLDTLKYKQLNVGKGGILTENIYCNAEILTPDNQIYLGSNGKEFGNAYNRTNEKARSGKHSVKMDSKTKYALEYNLNNLKPGDIIEVEVWRFSDNESGLLVVASKDAKQFYKSKKNAEKTDENGWDLIHIKFTVPSNLQNNSLKIYLWNKDKMLGYFDDLSIKKISPKHD
ncbi:MAG: hypothetical protein L3J11_00275 [Draconibacterium sp.]|nr:hypothetical protein [Draconibacterium sp.]